MPPERKEVCDCGALEQFSKEPAHPIRFDEHMNEYHLHHPRGQTMIYYCLFCGGRTPTSRRPSFFAHVSAEENSRLSTLLAGITTEKEVYARFGPPDEDSDHGVFSVFPEKDGKPEHGIAARTLKYTRLSDVAVVTFQAHGDGRVTRTWYSKAKKKMANQPATNAGSRLSSGASPASESSS